MNIQYRKILPSSLSASDWAELLNMTHRSYDEHAQNGLTMLNCSCNMELLQRRIHGNELIVAECGHRIVGYLCFRIRSNIGYRILDVVTMAVDAQYKRKGIGKRMHVLALEVGEQNNCDYAQLDTSCRAIRTRAAHRAAGYKDWYYTHFPNGNYYSIVMRKDLRTNLSFFSRLKSRIISWLKIHFKMNEEGKLRFMYRMVCKIDTMVSCPKHNLPAVRMQNCRKLTLRETQMINYNLLKKFSDFCDKHGLRYLLCYGTLIGAVRHKGFIPWDDDVDVTMPMPDYYKFRELFEKENKNSQYGILYGMKYNVGIPYTMLCDMRTLANMPGRDRGHARPVAIDIMPCYALSEDDNVAKKQIEDIARLARQSHKYLNYRNFPFIKRLVNRFILNRNHKLFSILSKIEEILNRYEWGSTKRVRAMAFVHTAFTCMNPEDFDDYSLQTFEKGVFRIPKMYHEQLTAMYGDYMELPPLDKRVANYSGALIYSKTEEL